MKVGKSKTEIVLSAHAYMWRITESLHSRYTFHTILILLAQVLTTGQAFIVGKGIDVAMSSNHSLSLSNIIWSVLVISILRCVLAIWESTYHIGRIAFDVEGAIQGYTMQKLFSFSPGQTTRENTGLKMDTLQKGSTAISELISLLAGNIIPFALKIAISIGLLFYINWLVGVCILVSSILFSFVSVKVNNHYVDDIRRVRKLESNVETKFWEIIKNLKLVITMAMQDRTTAEFIAKRNIAFSEGRKVWISYNKVAGLMRNLPFEHVLYAPILLLIFSLVQSGKISVGDIAVIISLISNVYSCLNNFGSIQRQLIRHSVNVKRLENMIEQEPECADIENPVTLENPKGLIVFKNVSFTYESDKPHALHRVSFRINPGETVAFVGASGSGKSTIVSLLLRSNKPQVGEISIDDLPLDSIEIKSLRKKIGIVSQSTMLWDESVRHNVLYGTGHEIEKEGLDEILRSARIDEFFDRLGEKGLDTLIGENGIQLSGGQCQRIAIARVLARDPSIIVLDEATSALDYRTESEVFEAMNNALLGRTGIIIAHRLGTVRKADRIIVLDKGSIVGEGTFDELSEKNKHFKSLIGSEIR